MPEDTGNLREERRRSEPQFLLGQTVVTRTALAVLSALDIAGALYRHQRGDWGDVGREDWQANERAPKHGERLLSVYRTADGTKFYVISEWDRSITTVTLTLGISVEPQGVLELGCDADVIDDQAARLVLEDSVHPRNRLHEVVAVHRLVHVHGVTRRCIESHGTRETTWRRATLAGANNCLCRLLWTEDDFNGFNLARHVPQCPR